MSIRFILEEQLRFSLIKLVFHKSIAGVTFLPYQYITTRRVIIIKLFFNDHKLSYLLIRKYTLFCFDSSPWSWRIVSVIRSTDRVLSEHHLSISILNHTDSENTHRQNYPSVHGEKSVKNESEGLYLIIKLVERILLDYRPDFINLWKEFKMDACFCLCSVLIYIYIDFYWLHINASVHSHVTAWSLDAFPESCHTCLFVPYPLHTISFRMIAPCKEYFSSNYLWHWQMG